MMHKKYKNDICNVSKTTRRTRVAETFISDIIFLSDVKYNAEQSSQDSGFKRNWICQ